MLSVITWLTPARYKCSFYYYYLSIGRFRGHDLWNGPARGHLRQESSQRTSEQIPRRTRRGLQQTQPSTLPTRLPTHPLQAVVLWHRAESSGVAIARRQTWAEGGSSRRHHWVYKGVVGRRQEVERRRSLKSSSWSMVLFDLETLGFFFVACQWNDMEWLQMNFPLNIFDQKDCFDTFPFLLQISL